MSNKRYVNIDLDKPRRLLLDMNSMVEFERVTGEPFLVWAKRMDARTTALARQLAVAQRQQAMAAGDAETAEKLKDVPAPDENDLKLPDVTMAEVRALLWCLMIHEDEALTIRQVGAMITPDNLETVTAAIIAAKNANNPDKDPQASKAAAEGEQRPLAGSPQS